MKEEAIAPAQVRAALERILGTEAFAGNRLGAFLRFVVEGSLAGTAGELKESVVGVEVYARPAGYDVRSDSVVRVEARRLRERLAEYYAAAGAGESVRIEIPKGGYAPVFRLVEKAEPASRLKSRRGLLWAGGGLGLAAMGGAAYWATRARPAQVQKVLVLPFSNLGGDDFFAAGLTEEVIDRLAGSQGMQVVSRGVAQQWRGKDPREAGQALGCSAVVEGSVRRNGQQLRIVARLIDPKSGVQLWSESFDRPSDGIFALQEEMARSVAAVLRVNLAAGRRGTRSAEALQSFLRGRHAANGHTLSGLREAVQYLELAVEQDPEYALAWAHLGSTYAVAGFYQLLPDAKTWPKAVSSARRALALDATLPDAHAALGMVSGVHDWNWKQASESLGLAIRLGPESAMAHGQAAIAYLMPVGKYAEANERFERAAELEPQSVFNYMGWAFNLLAAGAWGEAIAKYEALLRLDPQMPDVFSDYAMALGLAGRYKEAEVQYRRWMSLRGRKELDEVGLYFCGRPELARQQAEHYGDTPMDKARLWALLGEKERACGYLEAAMRVRDGQFFLVKADPRLRNLQKHPRYEAILRQVGLLA